MSRTIKEIYSEAIYVRNNYLQITELDSGRTQSKMSILNLMTYVMAVLIYSYEAVLDVFQVNVAKLIMSRINGTPAWYVKMALQFQYGDTFGFNSDTLALEYETTNDSHKIIKQAAWEEYSVNDAIILKVSKDNSDSAQVENGMLYGPLSNTELANFKQYIKAVKFVGAKVYCTSLPGDLITIKSNGASIYYDANYTSAENVLNEIKEALVNYAKSLKYNQYIYYQSFIDAIQSCEHVISIESGIVVEARSFNSVVGEYEPAVKITGQYRSKSGYIGFLDDNGVATINLTNLTLTSIS